MVSSDMDDPLEKMVSEALDAAGVRYFRESDAENPSRLDFYLADLDVAIEVKRFHSPRIADQMARAQNVIALQGEAAVRWFCQRMSL